MSGRLTTTDFATCVGRMLALEPGSKAAEEHRFRIEHLLMTALKNGGRAPGEQLVESLATSGYTLERIPSLPWMWRVAIPPPRVLELWFTGIGDGAPVVAALSYRVGKSWGTKAQQRAAQLQKAFYERYEKTFGREESLSADDRLIALVGEFEADVNNGGFRQYLDNKGPERAQEALAALTRVGAKRTARWLSSALKEEGDAPLDALDREFNEKGEDLARRVMTYLARQERS